MEGYDEKKRKKKNLGAEAAILVTSIYHVYLLQFVREFINLSHCCYQGVSNMASPGTSLRPKIHLEMMVLINGVDKV